MVRLLEILIVNRRTGSTSWILKSLLNNPKCIVISSNQKESDKLKSDYNKILSKRPWWFKLGRFLRFGKTEPYFFSQYDFDVKNSYKRPIVVDNSAIIHTLTKNS